MASQSWKNSGEQFYKRHEHRGLRTPNAQNIANTHQNTFHSPGAPGGPVRDFTPTPVYQTGCPQNRRQKANFCGTRLMFEAGWCCYRAKVISRVIFETNKSLVSISSLLITTLSLSRQRLQKTLPRALSMIRQALNGQITRNRSQVFICFLALRWFPLCLHLFYLCSSH